MRTKTKAAEAPKEEKGAKKKGKAVNTGLRVGKLRKALESKMFKDSFWTPVAGVNQIRILPMPNDSEMFWVEIQEAYIPKEDGKSKLRVVSPRSMDKDAYCPIDATTKALYGQGDKDLANELRTSAKYFINAAVKNKDTGTWEYKAAKIAYQVWRDLVEHCLDEADDLDIGDDGLLEASSLLDPKKGRVVSIKRREVNGRVEYKTTVTEAQIPIDPAWLDKCQDFANESVATPVKDIEAALCGFLDLDDLSELTGKGSKSKSKPKKQKAAPVDDDDDDDDDEDEEEEDDDDDADEDEEEEEEEDADDDDDDDADEDEEEEEEETPTQRGRGKAASRKR